MAAINHVTDLFLAKEERIRIAAEKKLCGMCGHKAAGREWRCTNQKGMHFDPDGGTFIGYICPAPEGDCPGFLKKPSVTRALQPKKKGLSVPPEVNFVYYGRPMHRGFILGRSSHDHQGIVTAAWLTPDSGVLHLGFSFCSPEDRWRKVTGRDMAMDRLFNTPLVIPFLYFPKRTVHEVVRAVLSHDFGRLAALTPGATMWGSVPSWTKDLAKRLMGGAERERRGKTLAEKLAWLRCQGVDFSLPRHFLGAPPINYSLEIMARMMADIAALGND